MLELQNVEMHYLTMMALKGISFSVKEGEIVGYIGPNGAGKTTTLNIISTLVTPTRGSVLLEGRNCFADVRSVRARIGYMFELFGVYDDMTVSEYLQFFCKSYLVEPYLIQRRIADSLAEVGLSDVAPNPISTLSKGMKQKLFFVKTFIHSPKLVLLDEPFTGLDPIACRIVREKVLREAANGIGFLIASHNMSELQEIVTRVVAIRGGKIVSDGPLEQLEKEYSAFDIKVAGDHAEAAVSILTSRFAGYRVTREGREGVLLEVPEGDDGREAVAALVNSGIALTFFARRGTSLKDYFEKELGDAGDH